MTENGVRAGGSPRAPRPDGSQEPETESPVEELSPEHPLPSSPSPSDWLAPEPPVAPPTDWLAPEPPVAPPTDWLASAEPAEPPAAARVAPPTPSLLAAPVHDEEAPLDEDETLTDEDEPFAEDEQLEDDEPEVAARPKLPLSERLKRTPPALVLLTFAAIGSTGFLLYEVATRTAPIAVLSSAAVVTGMVYVVVAVVCAIATYRSATDGRTWRAFLLAFIGGMAAIVAALSFAGALVLVLALGF